MSTVTQLPAIYGFEHTQVTPSTTWVIAHNIGTFSPVVDCFIDVSGEQTKIIPSSVVATNNQTVTITFSSVQAGTAYVI